MNVFCRWGWHSWRFVSMSNSRMVSIPGHSSWICELHQQCRRCGLRLHSKSAPIPKRVKV